MDPPPAITSCVPLLSAKSARARDSGLKSPGYKQSVCIKVSCGPGQVIFHPVMLTRPAGHEAEAEARKSEDEAEAQNFF